MSPTKIGGDEINDVRADPKPADIARDEEFMDDEVGIVDDIESHRVVGIIHCGTTFDGQVLNRTGVAAASL